MLYIVTAVHNRYQITKRFVETLKRQTEQAFRLILVDDGSTDGTDGMVRAAFPGATILYGDGNLWWGGALQMAYRYIASNSHIEDDDQLLLCNDDSLIPDDFLEKGTRLLGTHPGALITGCGYGIHDKRQMDGAVRYDFRKSQDTVLPGTNQGNCASTRELFLTVRTMRAIGPLHSFLLPHYLSDYEYTIRASKKGFPTLAFSELRYDFDEGTTGTNSDQKLSLRQLFSRRCMANPLRRFNFLFLVTPARDLPAALGNQIGRYAKKLSRRSAG